MTTSWAKIALLYGIGVLAACQLGIVPPLVPALQRDLGLSLAGAGVAVSIVTLIGAALGLPAGRWCDTIGHARALAIGLLIMAGAAVLCAVTTDATTLLVARGAGGLGYLLVCVAGPSLMVAAAAARHQPIALSLWGTFVPAGIALAGLAAASFADRWRILFAVDAAVLSAALIVALLALPRRAVTPSRPSRRALLEGLGSSVPLAIAFFCFALLFLALAGLLPAYLVDERGLGAADAGRIAAIATALGIPGSLVAAWLMKNGMAPGRLTALGLVGSTALAALAFVDAIATPLAIAGLAASFAVGGLVPAAAFASVPLVAADARAIGPINGLLAQAGSLGSLAGPPMLALAVEQAGWTAAPVLLIAVAAIGAAAALAIRRA
jgi:MFS family permease